MVLGNRKEITEEEQQEIDAAEEIQQALDAGDPNWLEKVKEYFDEGIDFADIPYEDFTEDL